MKYFPHLLSYCVILSGILSLISNTVVLPMAASPVAESPALLGTASLHLRCRAAASPEPTRWLTLAGSAVSGAGHEWSWIFEGKIEFDPSVPTGYHHRDYFL